MGSRPRGTASTRCRAEADGRLRPSNHNLCFYPHEGLPATSLFCIGEQVAGAGKALAEIWPMAMLDSFIRLVVVGY